MGQALRAAMLARQERLVGVLQRSRRHSTILSHSLPHIPCYHSSNSSTSRLICPPSRPRSIQVCAHSYRLLCLPFSFRSTHALGLGEKEDQMVGGGYDRGNGLSLFGSSFPFGNVAQPQTQQGDTSFRGGTTPSFNNNNNNSVFGGFVGQPADPPARRPSKYPATITNNNNNHPNLFGGGERLPDYQQDHHSDVVYLGEEKPYSDNTSNNNNTHNNRHNASITDILDDRNNPYRRHKGPRKYTPTTNPPVTNIIPTPIAPATRQPPSLQPTPTRGFMFGRRDSTSVEELQDKVARLESQLEESNKYPPSPFVFPHSFPSFL